jgi:hypothetical protein
MKSFELSVKPKSRYRKHDYNTPILRKNNYEKYHL